MRHETAGTQRLSRGWRTAGALRTIGGTRQRPASPSLDIFGRLWQITRLTPMRHMERPILPLVLVLAATVSAQEKPQAPPASPPPSPSASPSPSPSPGETPTFPAEV